MAVSRSAEVEGTAAMPSSRSKIEPFRCEVHPARDAVQVRPVGELDLATVPIVDAELADLWAVGFSSLVLDLREVCFLDSNGPTLPVYVDCRVRSRRDRLSGDPRPSRRPAGNRAGRPV
jgi:anti-anti-sigma factor